MYMCMCPTPTPTLEDARSQTGPADVTFGCLSPPCPC